MLVHLDAILFKFEGQSSRSGRMSDHKMAMA